MFEMEFLSALLLIIAIDIVLGGDNAVVIALASRKLPAEQKKKAILWGTGAAIGVRVLATFVAAKLLEIPYLYLIGGLLLVWISFKLLVDEEEKKDIKPGENLMQAIKTIVMADILMGLDNVLAIAGAAKGDMTLIIIGLLISVPIMIWGSHLILKGMERFPWIVYIGAGILAWTAAQMITHEKMVHDFLGSQWMIYGFNVLVVAAVVGLGLLMRNRSLQKSAAKSETVDESAIEEIAAERQEEAINNR
ncbi:TerC family protein [Brevibacillus humidisoli]|uniref:TerC family protein n=1 Tax=Brevibacillus humidisoli TaxID=2895522 RepID=UPI001E4722FE|nr:TerC family protein [Brevibacillus humidisoli]UFJ41688.1 TerC family protein [Brevibacillus humidisoli]